MLNIQTTTDQMKNYPENIWFPTDVNADSDTLIGTHVFTSVPL